MDIVACIDSISVLKIFENIQTLSIFLQKVQKQQRSLGLEVAFVSCLQWNISISARDEIFLLSFCLNLVVGCTSSEPRSFDLERPENISY